jgi:hypothetical protein
VSSPFSQATLQALGELAVFGTQGLGGAAVQLVGTFVGTVTFEASVDRQTWRTLNLTPTNSTTAATTATAAGLWLGSVAGLVAIRVRVTAYTSGSITVTFSGTEASPGGSGGGGGGAGGDGAILDGVTSSIRASVLDYLNAKPLAVRLSNTSGDYVAAGAGTQYTEDVAAAADPDGGVTMLVRKDTLAAITDADGDNVAQRGTNKGEGYVKDVDLTTATGGVTEAAPASDTASSGLNGRLQRIAQRVTSLIAVAATETTVSAMAGDLGDSADVEASGDGSLIAIVKRLRTLIGSVIATIGATTLIRVAVYDNANTQVTSFGGAGGSYPAPSTRSDTYTTNVAGTTVAATSNGVKHFGLQVTKNGAVTAWQVVLEGSIDGTTFTTLMTHTEADGDGAVIWTPQAVPALRFRSRCVSRTGGTDVTAAIVGMV